LLSLFELNVYFEFKKYDIKAPKENPIDAAKNILKLELLTKYEKTKKLTNAFIKPTNAYFEILEIFVFLLIFKIIKPIFC
tara:strand:- start:803 stop:1042 length:240 start_codon:yes stop_codon:yes gene_type:complete